MTIQEYITEFHDGNPTWFLDEVGQVYHQQRIMNILDTKEYLSGTHKILKRPNETYNGKTYEPRKIVLQYCKTILNFQTSYLLQNPVTLTGDKGIIEEYKRIYKKGKYDRIDFDILDKVVKYGSAYEYVYVDAGVIKSKLINPEDGYPVYNHANEMIAFIESYTVDSISYYTVYYEDRVENWTDRGGELKQVGVYGNASGLPVVYKNRNELDPNYGRSDLEDIINILDNMEDLLSKFTDSFYKFHNPIPVAIGQQLKGEGLPTHIVGGGIVLDDGADFKLVGNQLDFRSFETIYNMLKQALLDISNTPAVSLNSQDVSNLSEVSIKLLFSLADIKAGLNEKYMREGMEQRFEKIRRILELQGKKIDDEAFDSLGIVFQYSRPQNEKDIIDNLKVMKEIGGISLESILEKSPFTSDVGQELQRLRADNGQGNEQIEDKVTEIE
ncbi:phage portal protein [Brevibacillus fortis]|uniref:phage portal protein n=1 Tax=Brevibacillus fortis TaxID=2126352 RepID=UPI0038FCB7C0